MDKLTEYIEKQRSKNVSDWNIRKALLAAGWDSVKIDTALHPEQTSTAPSLPSTTTPETTSSLPPKKVIAPTQEFLKEQQEFEKRGEQSSKPEIDPVKLQKMAANESPAEPMTPVQPTIPSSPDINETPEFESLTNEPDGMESFPYISNPFSLFGYTFKRTIRHFLPLLGISLLWSITYIAMFLALIYIAFGGLTTSVSPLIYFIGFYLISLLLVGLLNTLTVGYCIRTFLKDDSIIKGSFMRSFTFFMAGSIVLLIVSSLFSYGLALVANPQTESSGVIIGVINLISFPVILYVSLKHLSIGAMHRYLQKVGLFDTVSEVKSITKGYTQQLFGFYAVLTMYIAVFSVLFQAISSTGLTNIGGGFNIFDSFEWLYAVGAILLTAIIVVFIGGPMYLGQAYRYLSAVKVRNGSLDPTYSFIANYGAIAVVITVLLLLQIMTMQNTGGF